MNEPKDAAALFADWLLRRETGSPIPIEDFARDHVAFEKSLLRMHGEWKQIMARFTALDDAPRASFSDRLRERFGSGVDPGISLDGDGSAAENDSSEDSKLYAELRHRGPSSGRYRLDAELAHGGMGKILKVFDKDLRRNLAMKVIKEEKQGRLQRFLEEAQVTGQLDHPGIVPVHELGIDPSGKVFFTMKLVRGKDLREVFELVSAGIDGWSVTRAIGVLLRVCEAMAFAHEKKVIHRDLKPANVMVGRHGEVYVMDWGLARVVGRKDSKDVRIRPDSQSVVRTERRDAATMTPNANIFTMDGDAVGTPAYMPLEQAEGNLAAIGPHSDVYAVGAMLYHLLTGRVPYHESDEYLDPNLILARVRAGAPASVRSLASDKPAELVSICERAMARKPEDRYASMGDFADDLRAYLERRVVRAHRTGALAEARMWIARNPTFAATIFAFVLAITTFSYLQHKQNVTLAEERERVFRLSDLAELRKLESKGEALLIDRSAIYRSYSAYPIQIQSMKEWIDEARALATRLPVHQATLEDLETRAVRDPSSGSLAFPNREDAWMHPWLSTLVAGIPDLSGGDAAAVTIGAMTRRVSEFESIHARSVGEPARVWEECIASIADPVECPAYGGLSIVPQIGLLPIGRDPRSRLWEFWLVDESSSPPARSSDGTLIVTADLGIVLVLVPGGSFLMGRQDEDESQDNYGRAWYSFRDLSNPIHDQALPPHAVPLAPFFVSKFELTEHQAKTLSARAGSTREWESSPRAAAGVSWNEAMDWLTPYFLAVPAEAQWEYACVRRSGRDRWIHDEESANALLAGVNPVADTRRSDPRATVGSFFANDYGLHDMDGGLLEWCLDGFDGAAIHPMRHAPFDGQPIDRSARARVVRGGTLTAGSRGAPPRPATSRTRLALLHRYALDPTERFPEIGIRPCRPLVRR